MKKTITYGLLLITSHICSFISDEQRERIRFILVESDANAFNESGEVFNLHTHTKIAFYKEYRVYAYPRLNEKYKKIDETVELIDDYTEEHTIHMLFESVDTTYRYVVIKEGDRYGLQYASFSGNSDGIRFDVDSANASFGLTATNFIIFHHQLLGEPVEVIKNEAGKVILEKLVIPKEKRLQPDSVYRFYDERLKDIGFSFIPELDKKHQSKAVKLAMIFKPLPKSEGIYQADIPRHETYWQMKEIGEKNPQDYLNLIERFKQDSKAMNLK